MTSVMLQQLRTSRYTGIYNSHLLDLMQCRLLTEGRISNVRPGLWCLEQVHACCIERQLITLQLELAGGQLELEF